jgi:outer membrane protein TolC
VRVVERLNVAYQQYAAAKRQAENFEQRILPNARESLRLILLGYETSDSKYDFTTVLQAQSVLAQARLTYVQVLNDLQRAVSEIEGVVQREPEGFFLKP